MQAQFRRDHFEGLDALRAAAALSVLGLHLTQFESPRGLFSHGYLGVDLFFGLSGYVIGHVYEPKLASGELSAATYAEIRLVRLMPMIWIGTWLGAFVAGLGFLPQDHIGFHVICQSLLIPNLARGLTFPLNGAQWSLFYELATNAAHALVVRRLTTPLLLLAVLLFGAIAAIVTSVLGTANYGFAGRNFPLGGVRAAFGFCAGLLLYRCMSSGRLKPAGVRAAHCAVPLFVVATWAAGATERFGAGLDLAAVLVVVPTVVWLGSSASYSPRMRRAALQAGLVSYPLYAVQGAIIHVLKSGQLGQPNGAAPNVAYAVVVCAVAYVLQVAVDAPVRRILGKALALRRTGTQVALEP